MRRLARLTALAAIAGVAACAEILDGTPPAPAPLVSGQAADQAAGQKAQESRGFEARCAAPEVVRCVSFDIAAHVPNLSWWAVGDGQGRGPMGSIRSHRRGLVPERDCAVSVRGCSLRFTVPSRSGAGQSGSWFVNFSDDFSVRFGEGEEFYVQWRQRFSRAFLETRFKGGGWKQAVIGEGDRPGYAPDGKVIWSCTQLELVVQNIYQRGYPQMYHSCGGKDGQYQGLRRLGAIPYRPDEWMTFQVRVKIGTWYRNDRRYRRDSEIELWVAREGERSRRAVAAMGYDLANNRPDAKYGKLWLMPYHTGKDARQEHATGHVWYDEVIISRAPIPDP